uniref:Si:ch211-216l23.2 n=1 Tax=Scophthalmus maximus TaxID=52904 RepID=A0A8D3AT57_SCOMX
FKSNFTHCQLESRNVKLTKCFSSSQRDYPQSLSQCLQERGLSVEMLYLQAESGLTRALQDVRAEGSPLCILVEHTNIALSSCTVIIFSESLKIHRNMPKEQAMDFVAAEYRTPPTLRRRSQLLDDFLDREKLERHSVPSDTRQLLMLLAEGVHIYPEEMETISEYVRSRQEHMQGETLIVPGRAGPFNLLLFSKSVFSGHISPSEKIMFLSSFKPFFFFKGSYPKTKPPPLLSLHRLPSPSLGAPVSRGPPSSHSLYNAPPGPRGPLLHHPPQYHPGSRGPHSSRGAPPSLKSARPPLLSAPGGSLSLTIV